MPYDIGDAVSLATTVRDNTGTPVDATPTPTLTVTRPDSTTDTPAVAHVGVTGSGQYQATTVATLAGTYTYSWVSTGTVVAAEPGQFSVAPFAVQVASLEEFKEQLNRNPAINSDYLDDGELRTYLGAATRIVEFFIGPISVKTFSERFTSYQGVGFGGVIVPRKSPLVSVVSIVPDNGSVVNVSDPTQVTVDTLTGSVSVNLNWVQSGVITYTAGRSAIPDNAKLAGMIIGQHLWQTQNGGGGLPFPGDTSQLVIQGSPYSIPNRAKELLILDGMNVPGIA
ncbi:phage gp6-like head-tail connector protein [Fodinicola feengrottensis]|uniref:Uncharacterized protein n=1 Tax=Fodinicola feengrottensis TaxID=435914 RepID=A0ABP4UFP5_9ACTN|nr:phage gp6-like head-tail connector protein [Fodinicola feengrottensis]